MDMNWTTSQKNHEIGVVPDSVCNPVRESYFTRAKQSTKLFSPQLFILLWQNRCPPAPPYLVLPLSPLPLPHHCQLPLALMTLHMCLHMCQLALSWSGQFGLGGWAYAQRQFPGSLQGNQSLPSVHAPSSHLTRAINRGLGKCMQDSRWPPLLLLSLWQQHWHSHGRDSIAGQQEQVAPPSGMIRESNCKPFWFFHWFMVVHN